MKILFLSSWFPYPPDNGSRIRAYNLLRALASRHDVTLLSFRDGREALDTSGLTELCHIAGSVVAPEFHQGSVRALLGLLSPEPRSIVDTYSCDMDRLVDATLRGVAYDVVIASELQSARYVRRSRGVPCVCDDIELGVIRDQFANNQTALKRLRGWMTWQKTSRYVAATVRSFSLATVVSEQEKDNLRRIAPDYSAVAVVPNGVDTDAMRPGIASSQPLTLIYSGALTYSANYHAMRYFLAEVWPLIKAQAPDVSLAITGKTDGVNLAGLPLDDSVKLTGYLQDIRPAVASAWACVVPLRVGAGTRLKILEAMALGTPVVSTSKGAEGLRVTPEHDILIADDAKAFAAQTVRLLRDEGLRIRLAENGRRLVEQHYGWRAIGDEFVTLVESVARREV